jgi:hypothetical protein
MQADIAYGDYMNAEADINRLQNLNQNIQSYREALQEAQKSKQVAGDQYLAAINASRKSAGQEPFAGYPEEAMGTRRVMPAVDRMGAPLTPDEEDMLRHTPPPGLFLRHAKSFLTRAYKHPRLNLFLNKKKSNPTSLKSRTRNSLQGN